MFVVIGTTTVDLFISGVQHMPQFDGDEFTTSSLTFCDKPLTISLGGNGGNSAYVLASLGAQAALCSATGTNELGDLVVSWLESRGIDLCGLVREDGATATTPTAMDAQLNRVSFYYPGMFDRYKWSHVPRNLIREAGVLLITGVPLLPGFRGGGFHAALEEAKAHGATTALDIGPAIGTPATLDEIRPFLPLVDYLLTNAYELAICSGTSDNEDAVEQLLQNGAQSVIVKRGDEGAWMATADGIVAAPSYPVEADVTIGAGDSFNAGFLHAVQRGLSAQEALRFANATASLVIRAGRVLGAPTAAAVEAFLDAHPAD